MLRASRIRSGGVLTRFTYKHVLGNTSCVQPVRKDAYFLPRGRIARGCSQAPSDPRTNGRFREKGCKYLGRTPFLTRSHRFAATLNPSV